jgi:hypothetical protein
MPGCFEKNLCKNTECFVQHSKKSHASMLPIDDAAAATPKTTSSASSLIKDEEVKEVLPSPPTTPIFCCECGKNPRVRGCHQCDGFWNTLCGDTECYEQHTKKWHPPIHNCEWCGLDVKKFATRNICGLKCNVWYCSPECRQKHLAFHRDVCGQKM